MYVCVAVTSDQRVLFVTRFCLYLSGDRASEEREADVGASDSLGGASVCVWRSTLSAVDESLRRTQTTVLVTQTHLEGRARVLSVIHVSSQLPPQGGDDSCKVQQGRGTRFGVDLRPSCAEQGGGTSSTIFKPVRPTGLRCCRRGECVDSESECFFKCFH